MIYKVVTSVEPRYLENQVNKLLTEGWKCQGGVAVVSSAHGSPAFYLQAMIKEITNNAGPLSTDRPQD